MDRPAFPSRLRSDGRIVGRDDEISRIGNLFDKAKEGLRHAALVGGEPGVGKSSLAAHVAHGAHAAGAVVLYGRCDEEGAQAFQPFAEALETLLETLDDRRLRGMGQDAAELRRLVPAVASRLTGDDLLPVADAEADRYRLFQAVVAAVSEVARDVPVVLVLDDLHWADKPTLLLLRHLLRAELDLRLLVIGTYRDNEVDRSHAFAEVLADLRREVGVERVTLNGLDRASVQALVTEVAGHELGPAGLELSDTLHRQTGGNPFFIAEVLRHLAESGAVYQDDQGRWTSDLGIDDLGLPEGVREVVGRRLSRLSDSANHVLALAAVAGPSFEPRHLAAVQGTEDLGSVLDALDEGIEAGLLADDGARVAFPHALVRQTLLDELSASRRMRMHRIVGEALETETPDDVEALAHHFCEAAADGVAHKAGDHSFAAARRARARSAYEEAIAHLERGIEALELAEPVDRRRRCELLLEQGDLERWFRRDADPTDFGLRAAEDARAIGSVRHLASAACIGLAPVIGTPDPDGAALAEEALAGLAALEESDDGLLRSRVDLLVLLAWHRIDAEGRRDEGRALAEEAVRLAADGPPDVRANATFGSWRWSPQPAVAEVEALIATLPDELHTSQLLCDLAQAHAADALSTGDLPSFEAVCDEVDRLAAVTHGWYPTYIAFAFEVVRALLDGRWSDAEVTLDELAAHAGTDPNATNMWASNLLFLLREQGRSADALPLLQLSCDSQPGVAGFRAALAMVQTELGLTTEGRETFAPLAGPGIDAIPYDQTFPITFAMVAEVAARLADTDSCSRAYARMTAPEVRFEGRVASVSGALVIGAADRFLGMLAATLQRWDDADRHFDHALRLEQSLGSRPGLVRTRTWRARMLLDRGRTGDVDEALAELHDVRRDAEQLAMTGVVAELDGMFSSHS